MTRAPLPGQIQQLQAMADALVPAGVVAVCRDVDGDVGQLFAIEHRAVENAVSRRQAEFAAGRVAARIALGQLGLAPIAIPVGVGRSPVWPAGYTGSISHCRTAAIVVASELDPQVGHIGVDVEEAEDLEHALWDSICRPEEIDWLSARPDPGRWAKLIFCAKEAVFKAQYPDSERLLDFHEVSVPAPAASGRMMVRILAGGGQAVDCRYASDENFVLAFAAAR